MRFSFWDKKHIKEQQPLIVNDENMFKELNLKQTRLVLQLYNACSEYKSGLNILMGTEQQDFQKILDIMRNIDDYATSPVVDRVLNSYFAPSFKESIKERCGSVDIKNSMTPL